MPGRRTPRIGSAFGKQMSCHEWKRDVRATERSRGYPELSDRKRQLGIARSESPDRTHTA